MRTFQKYYTKFAGTSAPVPKFVIFLTHDMIINAFMFGLGYEISEIADPAA